MSHNIIAPLVINAVRGGGHTHSLSHILIHEQKQFQVPGMRQPVASALGLEISDFLVTMWLIFTNLVTC